MTTLGIRKTLHAAIAAHQSEVIALCRALVQIDSQNPPGNTQPIATYIERWLKAVEGVTIERVTAEPPTVNLVVRLPMARPGPRLAFNGHLDTFPVGDAADWRVSALGGEIADGRLYGRGANDMKAGVASALMTLALLAPYRDRLAGELVLTLVGDEETGGRWGTQYLLEQVEEARADAMINGDVGSPHCVHVGEKGQLWLRVTATGRQAHGAHVHRGRSAIDALLAAIERIRTLRDDPVVLPEALRDAVERATALETRGADEARVLMAVTANIGTITGGRAINLVADHARADIDIRFPPGPTAESLIATIRQRLADLEHVNIEALRSCDATWTDPDTPVARIVTANASAATGATVLPHMRIGFSDARFYRMAGVDSIVYGPTPYNMGRPDEYVALDELARMLEVHALSAFDFLNPEAGPAIGTTKPEDYPRP